MAPMQSPSPRAPESAGPFPPDLHDVRHLRLKALLLSVWALASFGAMYFARELQQFELGDWPLGYWIGAQGGVAVFIGLAAVYAWAMNHFERQDAAMAAAAAIEATAPSAGIPPHA